MLPKHDPAHVPVHQAMESLHAELAAANPDSAALSLLTVGWFGRLHPSHAPHEEGHRPPHIIALELHNALLAWQAAAR